MPFLARPSHCLRALAVFMLAFAADAACAETAPSARASSASSPGAAAIFRSDFTTVQGPMRAGTSFAVRLPNCADPVLLTALHVFGPSGGMREQMTPDALRHGVSHVKLLTDTGRGDLLEEFDVSSLTPNGAEPCCEGHAMHGVGDVAAFSAPASLSRNALLVAGSNAVAGQRVFVLAFQPRGGVPGLRHEAIVQGMQDGYLAYRYLNSSFELRATSGAPVVNEAGEVIAINLGGGDMGDHGEHVLMGVGNPAPAWRGAVEASCRAK